MIKKGFEDAILTLTTAGDALTNTPVPSIEAVEEWRNYADRKLYLDFEIGPFLGQYQKYILRWNIEDQKLEKKDRKAITIYINSPGGYLHDCFAFIDILKMSETPIKLICMGMAYSAAGYILMTKNDNITRYMLPHSKVLVHQGSVNNLQELQTTQLLDTANHVKQEEDIVKKYILDNTTITEKLYNKKKKDEWMLNAEQCLKLSICDKIVDNMEDLM